MNAMPDSIIVNSCQYTPVYLIQDPGASQGQSYFLAQSSVEEPKPISDNLKSFYESSGNIESFVNVNNNSKPRILKKQDSGVVGNNLKLASFLLPKNENSNKQQYVVNSVVLKPNVTLSSNTHSCTVNTVNNPVANTVSTTSTINTVPRLNIDSKIVKLKDTTFNGTTLKTVDGRRYNRVEKASPKIKPKEIPPILQGAPSKHTSVQLLKLGETYHSLSQLNDEQMKMVTQALKIFSNPEKIAPEPAYDPVTNTKFIYKVVSPRDLTVVGKNKVVPKEKKYEPNIEAVIKADLKKDHIIKSETRRETITKELTKRDSLKKENFVKDIKKKENIAKEFNKKDEVKKEINILRKNEEKFKQKIKREIEEEQEMAEAYVEPTPPKVTRSGRKVKLPKLSLPEGIPQKPKKKNTYVTCFQCYAEFPSLYRLQKHYEMQPTHIPAKIHSNLFHCLLAIVKSGTEEHRANIFIQQLEQLIVKLRSLLPCMLKNMGDNGKEHTISEDVGRLLGMNPGKYHLDTEALNCVKNKDGYCYHSPPPPPLPKDPKQEQNGTQSWITMNHEDILANTEMETEDCARTNSVEKWPTVNKRVWKQKQQKSQEKAKRMRLASENSEILVELGMDDLAMLGKPNECSEEHSAIIKQGAEQKAENPVVIKVECDEIPEHEVCANIVEQEHTDTCPFDQTPQTAILETNVLEDQRKPNNHSQFHSAHFDIRSSPIKPTSTIFRKFQINPELLAKYEAQIIRSIETVDKDHDRDKEIPCPTVEEVLQTNENTFQTNANAVHTNANVLQISAEVLHSNENILNADILQTHPNVLHTSADITLNSPNLLHNNIDSDEDILQNSPDVLHTSEHVLQTSPDILCDNENVLQTSQEVLQNNDNVLTSQDDLQANNDVRDALVNDDTLQEIFRDEDLSAVKESFILDRELKDWILNRSNDEKSEDGFIRSNSLIEPALLHVRDDEIKSQLNICQKVDSPVNDNNDESSVLNFLDTFATDCLSYPGTEIRTNNGDFQLDFSFHSS